MGQAPLLFFGNLAGGSGDSELPALPPHAQAHALKAGRLLTYVLVLEPQSRANSYRILGRPTLKASEGMNTAPKVAGAPSPPRPLGRPASACTAHLAPQPLLPLQPTPSRSTSRKQPHLMLHSHVHRAPRGLHPVSPGTAQPFLSLITNKEAFSQRLPL